MNHHETAVHDRGPGTRAQAACDCNWRAPWREDLWGATGDATAHEREVAA